MTEASSSTATECLEQAHVVDCAVERVKYSAEPVASAGSSSVSSRASSHFASAGIARLRPRTPASFTRDLNDSVAIEWDVDSRPLAQPLDVGGYRSRAAVAKSPASPSSRSIDGARSPAAASEAAPTRGSPTRRTVKPALGGGGRACEADQPAANDENVGAARAKAMDTRDKLAL